MNLFVAMQVKCTWHIWCALLRRWANLLFIEGIE